MCESVDLFGLQQLSKTGSAKAAVAALGKAVQLAAAGQLETKNVLIWSDCLSLGVVLRNTCWEER